MAISEILLLHHSHTDIGYTNYQDNVFALQRDYMGRALDLAERYADGDEGERFVWTCETTVLAEDFFRTARTADIERALALARAGLLRFGGMFCNVTPLYSADLLERSLAQAERLRRDYRLDIRYALNCDVNGQSWGLVEMLLDSGFEGIAMALNRVMARDPQPRPRGFRWEGPSGRAILAWNGEHYGFGHHYGIPRVLEGGRWTKDIEASHPLVAAYLARLESSGYPHDFAFLQITSTFMWDNGGPQEELVSFVREWNRRGYLPRMRIGGLEELFARLGAGPGLPLLSGDWSDSWAQGVGSSAYETALVRRAQSRLASADLLSSVLPGVSPPSDTGREDRARAVGGLSLYCEHTWGGFDSVSNEGSANARGQWYRKASYAYEGNAAATRLVQAAMNGLASRLPQPDGKGGLTACVFNPLPWPRRVSLMLPRCEATGWEEAQFERNLELDSPQGTNPPIVDCGIVDLPACGYALVDVPLHPAPESGGIANAEGQGRLRLPPLSPQLPPGVRSDTSVVRRGWVMENSRYRVELDPRTGAIASLVDKTEGAEWVDSSTPWKLGEYVRETNLSPRGRDDMQMDFVSSPDFDRQPFLSPERRGPDRVIEAEWYAGRGSGRMLLRMSAPGVSELRFQVVLYDDLPWIDLVYDFSPDEGTGPESTYIAFPLALEKPEFRYEAAGAIVRADEEQLPFACRDFYAVQDWVDVRDASRGMSVALPDAPLVHFGGFTNHRYLERRASDQPLLVSWPLNNHWMTNFRPRQDGWTRFRYRLLPGTGPFDPVAATRFGAESSVEPLVGPLWDRPAGLDHRAYAESAALPADSGLLSLEPDTVRLVSLRPGDEPGTCVAVFQELAGLETAFSMRVGAGTIVKAARRTKDGAKPLDVAGGILKASIGRRELVAIELEIAAGTRR
jgi:alpha-mannosidase